MSPIPALLDQAGPNVSSLYAEDDSILEHAVEHAAHLLPAQGPINVFIHHNTLHALEELPFDDAVVVGSKIFGCQPYLTEDRFHEKLAKGRILSDDLKAVVQADLTSPQETQIASLVSLLDLRLAMLRHRLRVAPPAELRWFVAQTDALTRFRPDLPEERRTRYLHQSRGWFSHFFANQAACGDGSYPLFVELLQHFPASRERWTSDTWEAFTLQALWRVCRQGVHGVKQAPDSPEPPRRHRDLLLQATGEDSDLLVHDVLIRFCEAFLDQGLSHWLLPLRDEGIFKAFAGLYGPAGGPPDAWLAGLPAELARIQRAGLTPLRSIRESLNLLGVPQFEWEMWITSALLALRGWAGMIRQIEVRADRVPYPVPPGSLIELLAVRLILERLALAHVAAESLGYKGPLNKLREVTAGQIHNQPTGDVDCRAFAVFQLAQVLGWLPSRLHELSKRDWSQLVHEIEAFSHLERRRIFQAAYERRYRVQALDAIALHNERPLEPHGPVKFQVACCLDEREESFRRHLEEVEPAVETFGPAGFYSVAMYYRGAAEANFVPLCPIIIQPKHWVVEEVAGDHEELHGRRTRARRVLGKTSHQLHLGSRSMAGGALISAGLGALAAVPLVARVLFPRLTAQIRRLAGRLLRAPENTRLRLERTCEDGGPENGHVGFSLDEMAATGERLLRDIGLTDNFARLVVFLGHGSFSLNNPHNSAYNCGACGGSFGGPNARAFAHMVNDPRVRERLKGRGIEIPETTLFIGGYHNTCNDEVGFYDLDALPQTHQSEYDHLRKVIDETCARNAHERCRRFMSAPVTLSFAAAKKHVEGRAEDLAQTRPELGHATNALCVVGRRSRTRGLYMDRRAFLTTYDPTQDDEQGSILLRVLQAAVPVCGGINLEYYFSHVDPVGYGCGTKLPHNVTSLLGVMDGAASDLRTGLPWQMTELHEPVRLLFIIETTPQVMLGIMDRNAEIGRLCRNGWVQLATLSPNSQEIHVLQGTRFEPYQVQSRELPQVASSADWYRGRRDHLGFAEIVPTGSHAR